MRFGPKAALGVAALIGALALGTSANAAYIASFTTTNGKCNSAKMKLDGKGVAGYTGCWAKNASKNIPGVDPICTGKTSTKTTAGYAKLDAKGPSAPCSTTGDGGSGDTANSNYAISVDAAVGHGDMNDPSANKCDAAKQKLVGKYVAAIMGCYAKAAAKLPGTVDSICTGKAQTKLSVGIGKAEAKPPCTNTNALQAAADNYANARACHHDPGNASPLCAAPPVCTVNGINDPGEHCDPSAPAAGWADCGSDFTCTGSCNCACPTKVTFTGTATDPASILDTGWTGISHRAPIISNGDVTVTMSCAATSRPCGTCGISGPIPNPQAGAGQLDNHRCSHDSAIHCANDAACGVGNTCKFYFGSNLALAAGGVSACVINTFNGNVSGTANVETGQAATSALLTSVVFLGLGPDVIDNPCPRCIGDATMNDGVKGGTCDVGQHPGATCDANGLIPGRPDFGSTSLDCGVTGTSVAVLPIDLTNATSTVTKTLSASNPKCSGVVGPYRCLCDTCNNLAATPCSTNGDCVTAGATICGGKRCLSGGNSGAACSNNSECPGGSCTVPGTGTRPSGCNDTTVTSTLDCTDQGNGEGLCSIGPVDQHCSVASNHAQRGCTLDSQCGGGVGSCIAPNQACFLTGGLSTTQNGTGTLQAVGMADTPMGDTSNPTLGAVFCVGPTTAGSINTTSGLPGPGRVTIKGLAKAHP